MCTPFFAPIFGILGGAAAGAATATGVGATLATIGTVVTAVGSIAQGVSSYRAGKKAKAEYAAAAKQNALLKSQEDDRMRRRMRNEMGRQNLQLAARGIDPDSPTVQALGAAAQEEMDYQSQAIQSDAAATTAELSSAGRAASARGTAALLGGGLSAVSSVMKYSQNRWDRLNA